MITSLLSFSELYFKLISILDILATSIKNFYSTSSPVKLGFYDNNGVMYAFSNNINKGENIKTFIAPENWRNTLLLVGICYNSDKDYWEYNIEKELEKRLSDEFKADLILTSLLYKGNRTYNKELKEMQTKMRIGCKSETL